MLFLLIVFLSSNVVATRIVSNDAMAIGIVRTNCSNVESGKGFCSKVYRQINDTLFLFDLTPKYKYCEIQDCDIVYSEIYNKRGIKLDVTFEDEYLINMRLLLIIGVMFIVTLIVISFKKESTRK
ncbi:hypothetical protein JXM83_03035 [Candidatus Woesearchaeota archaeon]|nr:hypothetical protein [Candidatus Woesearchaeota archaeon]